MTIRLDENYTVEEFEYDDDLYDDMLFEREVADMSRDDLETMLMELNGYGHRWDIAYAEYCRRAEEEQKRFYEENIDSFLKFEREFKKHLEDGTATSQERSFYSDWHKDMYGVRPRWF